MSDDAEISIVLTVDEAMAVMFVLYDTYGSWRADNVWNAIFDTLQKMGEDVHQDCNRSGDVTCDFVDEPEDDDDDDHF